MYRFRQGFRKMLNVSNRRDMCGPLADPGEGSRIRNNINFVKLMVGLSMVVDGLLMVGLYSLGLS